MSFRLEAHRSWSVFPWRKQAKQLHWVFSFVNVVEENLDKTLLSLVHTAQCAPHCSRERRKALSQLLKTLRASNKLYRPHSGKFKGFYEDIYEEALQRLFFHICTRIDDYNSEKGSFLAWVNFLLLKRFFTEASREYVRTSPRSTNAIKINALSLDSLSNIPSRDVISSTSNLENSLDDLRTYIAEDSEKIFQSHHIQGHPDANFQNIFLMRLDGYSWKEIADNMSVSAQSLSSFYQRSLKRFTQKFRKDLM